MKPWNTLAEVRQAIDQHKRPEWRNWRKEFRPRPNVLRIWWMNVGRFVLNAGGNLGLGHLGDEDWHARSWGLPIVNPQTRELLEELLGKRPDCYGYIRLTQMDAAVQFMIGVPPHLHPVADLITRGEEDAYIPVVAFRCAELDNQVRLRILTVPPPT